jgi:hypothetical protein
VLSGMWGQGCGVWGCGGVGCGEGCGVSGGEQNRFKVRNVVEGRGNRCAGNDKHARNLERWFLVGFRV